MFTRDVHDIPEVTLLCSPLLSLVSGRLEKTEFSRAAPAAAWQPSLELHRPEADVAGASLPRSLQTLALLTQSAFMMGIS